jgi:hypothetical protein
MGPAADSRRKIASPISEVPPTSSTRRGDAPVADGAVEAAAVLISYQSGAQGEVGAPQARRVGLLSHPPPFIEPRIHRLHRLRPQPHILRQVNPATGLGDKLVQAVEQGVEAWGRARDVKRQCPALDGE